MSQKKISELEALLSSSQSAASGGLNSDIANRRARLIERYNADFYGDEVQDRSNYVATDARDDVEAVKPELMDIFVGGDQVVEFDPVGEDDVERAEQETAVCNHIFFNQNEGYKVTLDWFHDALTQKNGYVKRYWDKRITTEIEEYEDLDAEEFEAIQFQLSEDDDISEVEVLKQSGGMVPVLDEDGEPVFIQNEMGLIEPATQFEPIAVKFRVKRETNKYKIVNVPPEEVIVHPEWTKLEFDGCPFHAHKAPSFVTDLIAEGFDRKQVEDLPSHDVDAPEKIARKSNSNSEETQLEAVESIAMKRVLIYENYIHHDMDGDGIAELLQVFTDENGNILKRNKKPAIMQVNGSPFNVLSPIPIPHSHYGLCYIELVEDLARVKTWVTRQMLDNMSIHNNPDTYVDVDRATDDTIGDVTNTATGRVIRGRGHGAVQTIPPVPLLGNALQALEHIDAVKEGRTGVTKYNQGLDANSLNKTAAGMDMIISQSQKKVLLVARNFAETGFRRLFVDMHRDLRKGPVKQLAIKLRGNWINENPRSWRERTGMSVSVGLGTGDRDIQFSRLSLILQQQKEMLAADPAGMVSNLKPGNIHHTLTKMIELSGFKDARSFFPDPAEEFPQPQPAKDPADAVAEAEVTKAQLQAQTKKEEMSFKEASDRRDAEVRMAIAQMEIDAKKEIEASKLGVDAQIAREKMEHEKEIAQRKLGAVS